MELKVWVEGIQRVVCGVSDVTTCQDVVIALAHATGKTGRFTLIERWRENERLVAPTECPLKLLRNWGEYASDVQFVLRHSGDKARTNSKSGYKRPHNEDKLLHNFVPQIDAQPRGIVKRNLTFSGAHNSMAPLRPNVRKTAPFENSSLDSVEEHSSLSSQSSSSPYSSFQCSNAADPLRNRVPFSHYRYEQSQHTHPIMETSKSPNSSSPIETPTNSLERVHRNGNNHERAHRHDRNLERVHRHYEHSTEHENGTHKVLSSSLPVDPVTHNLYMSNKMDKLSPRAAPHGYVPGKLKENYDGLIPNKYSTNPEIAYSNHSSRVNPPHNGQDSNYNHMSDNTGCFPVGNNTDTYPDYHSQSSTSPQQFILESSSETDENKNSKKPLDYGALLKGKALQQISREDLVKLVNLQIERLNSQESHMKTLDTDISLWGEKENESSKRVKLMESEISQLQSKDKEVQSDIEELEIVSWADKLEMERQCEKRLSVELGGVRAHISSQEKQIHEFNVQYETLEREIEEERRAVERHKKEVEIQILQEISELQKQINQKLTEHEQCERSLEELSAHVKQLESAILEKKMQMAALETELKDVNLDLFNSSPEENGEEENKTETCIQFTRSSSSRPGSSRKMPTTPGQLKDAIQSEPQGYWV